MLPYDFIAMGSDMPFDWMVPISWQEETNYFVNLVGKFRKADVIAHAVGQVESSIWMSAAGGARQV